MNILKIRLKDFRGIPERTVNPNPTGVTVITAPNETGKSSLIEGLGLALTELDSSRKRYVMDVKPIGRDVGPEVEIEVSAPPYRFTLRKRWTKHPITELRVIEPRAEALSGREAHERVMAILSGATDLELFRALQVIQGEGLAQPSFVGSTLLTRALDQAAGQTGVTEEDVSLFDAVEKAYLEDYTTQGDERQVIGSFRDELVSIDTRLREFQTKTDAAESEVKTHARLTQEIARVGERLVTQESELRQWEERLDQVSRLRDALRVTTAETRGAEEVAERTSAALDARSRLAQEVQHQITAVAGLKTDSDAAILEARHAKEAVDLIEAKVRSAEETWNTAKTLATLRANDKEKLRLQFDLQMLSERLTSARGAQEDLHQAEEILTQNKLTDQVLDRLREFQTAETVARGKLESSGAKLAITALADIRPVVDGKTIPLKKGAKHEATVTDRSVVELAVGARIEFRPGTSLAQLQTKHTEAAKQIRAAFQEAGVKDMAGAVEANQALQGAQTKRRDAQRAIRQALRTDYPEPFADVNELAAKVAELQGRLTSLERDRPPHPPLPATREEADRLARTTADASTKAEQGLNAFRGDARRAQQEFQACSIKAAGIDATVTEKRRILSAASSRLDEERQSTSDAELATQAERARLAAEQQRNSLGEAEKRLAAADPESVQVRTESLRTAVQKSREESETKRSKLAEVSGRLSHIVQEGIYDQLEEAKRARESKGLELASRERRARAAKLLFQLLSRHRSEAQRAYLGPLRSKIEELGRIIYGPSLKVELAEDLSVVSREIDGLPVPFESLSKGAQEQLGIITRLAVAMVVGKDGSGVPVIVDDALGYTDPQRLLAMGAILDRAGRDCQVIVLTCQPERYAAVGSAAVVDFSS
jgi:chromosome segregation ATPase